MIAIIAAVAENGVIGKDNELPWRISEDLKHFKETTNGNTIVMGRKTYESIGIPLPNRNNIVISRTMKPIDGIEVCNSVETALEAAKKHKTDIYIIGGANIYEQTMPLADKLIISHVKGNYKGDVYFPTITFDWEVEEKKDMDEFELIIYRRKTKD